MSSVASMEAIMSLAAFVRRLSAVGWVERSETHRFYVIGF